MARDYLSEFKGKCLTCKKYDIFSKGDATLRGYRCLHHMRPMAMDEECSSYGFDYTRSNRAIEEAVEWIGRRGYEPKRDSESCYITTMICKILGKSDSCEELTNLRLLRDKYMTTFDEGLKYLHTYDTFGPLISKKMEEDFNSKDKKDYTLKMVRDVLYPEYILVVNNLIKEKRFETAMLAYVQMTYLLVNKYNIYEMDINIDTKYLNINEVGHARCRKLSSY